MKIAIIGAGIYGCYISWKLKEEFRSQISVDLYDKNNSICLEASQNNQHRFHLGFHYPRSLQTIEQILNNYEIFYEDFKDCIVSLENNFYAVHNQGYINFEYYIKRFQEKKIYFEIIDKQRIKTIFRNIDDIDGIINTKEKCFNLQKLKESLYRRITINGVNLLLNKEVELIENNYLFVESQKSQKYDLIINTTYNNPNLGLYKNKFDIKYELCVLPVVENFLKQNTAITIMDGDFVSVYPDASGFLTLSSVKYTPYKKYDSYDDFKKDYKIQEKIIQQNLYDKKVLEHVNEFLNLPRNLVIKKIYNTPKIKLKNDLDAIRISEIKKEESVLSILCGKIDAVCQIYNMVKQEVR